MISIQSEIEGKEARYGDIKEPFSQEGFVLGGSWDFDGGYLDCELDKEEGETVYLRIPVKVVQGQLDEADARLRFLQPFLVRHVVNLGISDGESEGGPLESAFVQFQTPLETDGEIHHQDLRIDKGKKAIQRIFPYVQ